MKKKINKTKKLKKNDITKPLPCVKSLGGLMKDENGFVSKETVLKVGLSTVAALGAALGIVGALTHPALGDTANKYQPIVDNDKAGNSYIHSNAINLVPDNSGVVNGAAQHTNVTTHVSY